MAGFGSVGFAAKYSMPISPQKIGNRLKAYMRRRPAILSVSTWKGSPAQILYRVKSSVTAPVRKVEKASAPPPQTVITLRALCQICLRAVDFSDQPAKWVAFSEANSQFIRQTNANRGNVPRFEKSSLRLWTAAKPNSLPKTVWHHLTDSLDATMLVLVGGIACFEPRLAARLSGQHGINTQCVPIVRLGREVLLKSGYEIPLQELLAAATQLRTILGQDGYALADLWRDPSAHYINLAQQSGNQ